jgi:hypothetical protein
LKDLSNETNVNWKEILGGKEGIVKKKPVKCRAAASSAGQGKKYRRRTCRASLLG